MYRHGVLVAVLLCLLLVAGSLYWGGSGVIGFRKSRGNLMVVDLNVQNESFECITPKISDKAKICLNDEKDSFTKCMRKSGEYEQEMIKHVVRVLEAFPEMGVVDLGANVGYFALIGAVLGHPAIAADPVERNINLIRAGAQASNVTSRFTLLYNVIGAPDITVPFIEMGNSCQSGVVSKSRGIVEAPRHRSREVQMKSISINNLLPVVKFKQAFMKMDIEGNELVAIENADDFFAEIDVPLFTVEWGEHASKAATPRVQNFLHFFSSRGYDAFNDKGVNVTGEDPAGWGWDVWFVRKDCLACVPPYVDWYTKEEVKRSGMPPRC